MSIELARLGSSYPWGCMQAVSGNRPAVLWDMGGWNPRALTEVSCNQMNQLLHQELSFDLSRKGLVTLAQAHLHRAMCLCLVDRQRPLNEEESQELQEACGESIGGGFQKTQ